MKSCFSGKKSFILKVLLCLKERSMGLMYLIAIGLCTLTPALDDSEERQYFAKITEVTTGQIVAEFEWLVGNVKHLLEMSRSPHGGTIPGPEFYTGQPGYKVRLSLTAGRINPVDEQPYLGVWFSLVEGRFDDVLEWPFQYKLNLTLVDRYHMHPQHIHLSMNPMTAICRLRKQFLRPRTQRKNGDGCGKALFIQHAKLLNDNRFMVNDTVLIRATIFLDDRGSTPKRAKAVMRGHQLVSEFLWEIEDIDSKIALAANGDLRHITSDLFYINSESYLIILQMTINVNDEYLGLFMTLVPGDFDDTLEWPFAYQIELSLVDQSPGYLPLDRKGTVDPRSGVCPLSAFTKPLYQPNVPCGFRKLINFKMLQSRNFKKNGNLLVKFTAVLDKVPNFASLSVRENFLVADYIWRVPNIERKMQLAKAGRLINLLSERFYITHQGYHAQLQIKFQNNTDGFMGLYLTLLEGEYDSLLEWPFNKKFQLFIIDQQTPGEQHIVVPVDPKNPYITSEACVGSFWRPFGRNDACGSSNVVLYDNLYGRKFIRYGAMLLKVTIFLEELHPPRFATLSVSEGHLVSQYEWIIENFEEKILRFQTEDLQFIDSKKFYLSSNGYRMMLRLYPEKVPGYVGLYAVLTKGAYDDELQWPFKHEYQLEILDLSNDDKKMDITRTTYPSTSASGCPAVAFKKPDLELAEWSCGEGSMMKHETLLSSGYIKDGKIRVRIKVFLQEITPTVASLNFDQGMIVSQYSWLIERISDKLKLLKRQEMNRIESPIFYTGNQGYAVRASIALNKVPNYASYYRTEDNDDDFTVGLYFTLYQGKYDATLQWPFSHTVIFSVINKSFSGVNYNRSIDPLNTKCPTQAFHKPLTIQNEHSCGFSALMSLEDLRSYVNEDTLLIRASIVIGDLKKQLTLC